MPVTDMKLRWTCPWTNKLKVFKSESSEVAPCHVCWARPFEWLRRVLFILWSGKMRSCPSQCPGRLLPPRCCPRSSISGSGGVLRQEAGARKFPLRWGEREPRLISEPCSFHLDFKELKCLGKCFHCSSSSSWLVHALHGPLFWFPNAALHDLHNLVVSNKHF